MTFVAGASGGLLIDDAFGAAQVYSGSITSFGGATHTNHSQSIDLLQVISNSTVSAFYTSVTASGGFLTVTSGPTHSAVALINFIGHYATSNFQIGSGFGGTVKIVDPTLPNGGSVVPGAATKAFPRSGVDLPDIAFGAHTTLAYSRERRRHRRHPDGERWAPRRGDRAPRQLHGRKLRHRRRRPWRHAGHRGVANDAAAANTPAPELAADQFWLKPRSP